MYRGIVGISLFLFLISYDCWASPTGLNNIPTTDVVENKMLVLQGWSTIGDDAKPLYMTGFKYGLMDSIEVGLDSKVGSGGAGPIAAQVKLRLYKSDFGLSFLIGTEGMSFDKDFSDDINPYAVATQDLKFFRLHAGYNFQKDNFGVFGGADRTFRLFDKELILRSDIKQINDGEDLLISGGFLLTLPFNLLLEAWLSIPTEDKAEESVTVKLNYIIKF